LFTASACFFNECDKLADPFTAAATFRLPLGSKKSSFPSPAYSGIAEIDSIAMIDDLLDPQPRFRFFDFLFDLVFTAKKLAGKSSFRCKS
jgi:hypothetical protein